MSDSEGNEVGRDTVEMTIDVPREEFEYLEEWADAVGCGTEDVAVAAIHNGLEGYLE